MGALRACPGCGTQTEVVIFPALSRRTAAGAEAESTSGEGEAGCFYHPTKRAQVPCDGCGRFLCGLCALPVQGRQLCPACLEGNTHRATVGALERSRTRWDNIAFSALVLPMVFCYIVVPVTSALVIAMLLWRWKAPPSLVDATRARYIVALVVAVLELALGIFIWAAIYWSASRQS